MEWYAAWIWGGAEASPRNAWCRFWGMLDVPADGENEARPVIAADSQYVL